MPVTITINDNHPQAVSLISYLKTLDFVKVKEGMQNSTLSSEEEIFEKNLTDALQEMKAIRKGEKKAKKLEHLLR